jgi:ABC-type sugar transport system ATPase subunit
MVMHNGSLAGSVKREDATEEKVLAMAMLEEAAGVGVGGHK